MHYILCSRRFAVIHGKSPVGFWQFWSILTRNRNGKRPFYSLPTLLSKGISLLPQISEFFAFTTRKLAREPDKLSK